jgi:hypothetical protein
MGRRFPEFVHQVFNKCQAGRSIRVQTESRGGTSGHTAQILRHSFDMRLALVALVAAMVMGVVLAAPIAWFRTRRLALRARRP